MHALVIYVLEFLPYLFNYFYLAFLIMPKREKYTLYICHGEFECSNISLGFSCFHHLPERCVVIIKRGRMCIYVLAGILFTTIKWLIWFWWWQHCNVKSSSDVVINIWYLEIKITMPIFLRQHLMSSNVWWSHWRSLIKQSFRWRCSSWRFSSSILI